MPSDMTYRFFQRDFDEGGSKVSHGPSIQTTRILKKGVRAGSVPPMHFTGKIVRAGSVPPRSVIGMVSSSSSSHSSLGKNPLVIRSIDSSGVMRTTQPPSSAAASAAGASLGGRSRPIYRRASIAGPSVGSSSSSSSSHHIFRASDFRPATSSPSSSFGISSPSSFGIRSSTSSSSSRGRPASIYRPSSQAGYGRSSVPALSKSQPALYRRASISGPGWRSRDVELEDWSVADRPSYTAAAHTVNRARHSRAPIHHTSSYDVSVSEKPTHHGVTSSYEVRGRPSHGVNNDVARKKVDYESQMNLILPVHEEYLSNLRNRTKVARDNLSRHKILLDRYLPLHMGPENDVKYEVENRYGELLSRMPQLEQREKSRRNQEDSDHVFKIEPYKPAPRSQSRVGGYEAAGLIANIPCRNSFTPKVSETRKRARDVLCKIKGDPRYFDFN